MRNKFKPSGFFLHKTNVKNEKSSTQFLHTMPQFVVKALLKKSIFKGLFMFLLNKELNVSFKRDIELKMCSSDFWFFFFLGQSKWLKVNFTCYKEHLYYKKFRGQINLKVWFLYQTRHFLKCKCTCMVLHSTSALKFSL